MVERGLEGWSRNKTAPQVLDCSGRRVLGVVGQVKKDPLPVSRLLLLLFPLPEGWFLGEILGGIDHHLGEKWNKVSRLVTSIHEATKEEDKLVIIVHYS